MGSGASSRAGAIVCLVTVTLLAGCPFRKFHPAWN
jgi:hypothetical protein